MVFFWESGRNRPRPQRLIPAADAFTVPANRRLRLLQMANPAFAVLFAVVVIWTSDIRERANTIQTTALLLWQVVIVVGLVMVAYLVLVYRRPPIALTSAGVRLKLRTISWDSLDASMPRSIPTSPARKNRSFSELNADPAFVAAVINYYRQNSAARAAIGQPGEYERVQAALSSASVAGGHA
jgi:RsiW-degrading membrane proteinase PrsW (M82 family)